MIFPPQYERFLSVVFVFFLKIILACENKRVQVKSLITGTDVHELPAFSSAVTALSVSNDCKLLYVACSDSKLYLYNFLTRELVATLIELSVSINDIRISEDNSFLFLTSGVIY